jgi:hypothetical protein
MSTKSISNAALLFLLATIIVSVTVLSLVPPVSRDALVHHLNIPKLYIQHGGIYEIPSMEFSYYPMNLDLLYLASLYLGNDIVPKLIHFSFALLTAWLIFSYLKRCLNATYALLGAVFFLSVPIIVKLSITVYVDLGLIFFSTASLMLLLQWIETRFQLKYLLLSAGACGLALGTKYNGLLTLFLMSLFVPFVYSRYAENKKGIIRSAGYGILFVVIALLVFSPWMTRNCLWKGNPVYPLYDNVFNAPVSPPSGGVVSEQTEQEGGVGGLLNYRAIVYGESWWQIAIIPLRIFFEGKDGSEKYFDGKLNPFLLILPMFAFWRARKATEAFEREKKIFLAFALLFFVFAFFSTAVRVRYISPIVPPLVILAIFGTRNIVEFIRETHNLALRKAGPVMAGLAIMLPLAVNAVYFIDQWRYVNPLSYLSGAVTRDEYIAKYRSEYPAMQYVNKNLPAESRLLFIFLGKRGYYCDREYIPDTHEQVTNLYNTVKKADSPDDLRSGFNKMGVTHLMVEIQIFNGWVNDQFDKEKQNLLREFFNKNAALLYHKNGVGVFRLIERS